MSQEIYSLPTFGRMMADSPRMSAYEAAITRAVRPGDSVLDLGCGPGIMAMLACQAGARRVYAIDTNPVIDIGRQLATRNGFGDKIEFLLGDSRQIQLPERVNVIVSDIRGVLPLFSHAIETLHDARARFLTEGGSLLPTRDVLFCSIVSAAECYEHIVGAWKPIPTLNLSSGLPLVLNAIYRERFKPAQVISEAVSWHTLDYQNGLLPTAQATIQVPVKASALAHGLGLWFTAELFDGIGYSTEPRVGDTVYGHTFLPWLQPVRLCEGDVCAVDLGAHLVGDDYVWRWETRIPASKDRAAVHFRQSTFYGGVFSPSFLKKHAPDFVPVLSEVGLAERWLLQAMDGKRSLEDIAGEAARLFPNVFHHVEDAFNRAADVAEKLAR